MVKLDWKIKETYAEKISEIFSKKAFLTFLETELSLYFLKKGYLIFPEMDFCSLKNKKFQEGTSEHEN